MTDFASQVFAHETHTYGSGPDPFTAPRLLLDGIGTSLGSLEDQIDHSKRKEQAKARPVRALERAADKLPMLWGHVRRLPAWIATAADFITVATALAAIAKFSGLW